MTDYRVTAYDMVQRAQEILDVHVYDAATRTCLACDGRPCPQREDAVTYFYRQLVYPSAGATDVDN